MQKQKPKGSSVARQLSTRARPELGREWQIAQSHRDQGDSPKLRTAIRAIADLGRKS